MKGLHNLCSTKFISHQDSCFVNEWSLLVNWDRSITHIGCIGSTFFFIIFSYFCTNFVRFAVLVWLDQCHIYRQTKFPSVLNRYLINILLAVLLCIFAFLLSVRDPLMHTCWICTLIIDQVTYHSYIKISQREIIFLSLFVTANFIKLI